MIPLLPFVAGLAIGAAAVSALRSKRAREALDHTGARLRGALDEAQSSVRAATRSGISLLRRSAGADAATTVAPEAGAGKAKAPSKPPRRRTAATPTKNVVRKGKNVKAGA